MRCVVRGSVHAVPLEQIGYKTSEFHGAKLCLEYFDVVCLFGCSSVSIVCRISLIY
jgi:hypothetical protein